MAMKNFRKERLGGPLLLAVSLSRREWRLLRGTYGHFHKPVVLCVYMRSIGLECACGYCRRSQPDALSLETAIILINGWNYGKL